MKAKDTVPRADTARRGLMWMTLGVVWLCVGCEPAPKTKKNGATNSRPSATATNRAEKPVPSEPPKPKVPADAFKDVPEAVAALLEAAKKDRTEEFLRAEAWLVMQGDVAVEPLAQVLNNDQGEMVHRIAVFRTIRQLGPKAKPALQQALKSPSQQVQLNAIKSLGLIKPPDQEIVTILRGYMADKDDRIRREAILALASVGPPAKDACAEKLLAILNNVQENDAVRDAAKRALKEVNPRRTFND